MMCEQDIVLCDGVRTPIGHFAKSLAGFSPERLLELTIRNLLRRTKLDAELIDGVVAGWVGQGSHAPNIARIASLNAGLPLRTHGITVQCNCVSGMEAATIAGRSLSFEEGQVFIACGTESMSRMAYAVRGPRSHSALRTMDSLRQNWNDLWETEGVEIVDCIEEGLRDPIRHTNMAETAEICAQRYGISRQEQDDYAIETFRRCQAAWENGFYNSHVEAVEGFGKDEYIGLRAKLIKDPSMLRNAPFIFKRNEYPFSRFYEDFGPLIGKPWDEASCQPSVTLFNACARSDAAAAVLVTSGTKAKELGIKPICRLKAWAYWGYEPSQMGLAPAFAVDVALKRAGLKFADLDWIELHEAFAATVLSVFKVGEKEFGHRWREKWDAGRVNPNGGSIPLGHPLAATGTRLLLNLAYQMQTDPNARYGLAAACAAGGIGGAIIIERV
jgi:acetyl-CoA C-acetyltransferase